MMSEWDTDLDKRAWTATVTHTESWFTQASISDVQMHPRIHRKVELIERLPITHSLQQILKKCLV